MGIPTPGSGVVRVLSLKHRARRGTGARVLRYSITIGLLEAGRSSGRTYRVQNPVQKAIETWLLRTTANHNVRNVPRVASVIGTARGRVRPENQDKAMVAVFEAEIPRLDFYAFVACDGLGGMQDGGRCAALAASCFLT